MYFHMLPSLTFTLHVVMVTNLRHFVYLMDVNVHVKFQLDTITRTYFLGGGGGAQCAPLVFGAPKKPGLDRVKRPPVYKDHFCPHRGVVA